MKIHTKGVKFQEGVKIHDRGVKVDVGGENFLESMNFLESWTWRLTIEVDQFLENVSNVWKCMSNVSKYML